MLTNAAQAKTIADLTAANRRLIEMLSARPATVAPAAPAGPWERLPAEQQAWRRLTVGRYVDECYLTAKADLAPASIAGYRALPQKLHACFGQDVAVSEITDALLERFRAWLAARIARHALSAATANKCLRECRAIYSLAAAQKLIALPARVAAFPEPKPHGTAWTEQQLWALDAQCARQTGDVGGVPARIFWTALHMLLTRLGTRITATMLVERRDYDADRRIMLFRAANQKDRKDFLGELPPSVARAVESLFAAHTLPRLFGCWPYDPPLPDGQRKWKILERHWKRRLVAPAGIALVGGFHQCRRTCATLIDEDGGDATEQLNHAAAATTKKHYIKRPKVSRQARHIRDALGQGQLF